MEDRELATAVKGLSDIMFTAKKQGVERLDELTKELAALREGLTQASDGANAATSALVRWTKVMAYAALVYTVITCGLLGVAIWQLWVRGGPN